MKINDKKTNPYQTILVICIGLIIVYLWSGWNWAIFTALGIGILGLVSPFLANKIDYLWMQLAQLLSLFIPNILLSLIYFLLLVPIAFLSRVIGKKDALHLKKSVDTNFKTTNKIFDSASFKNPW